MHRETSPNIILIPDCGQNRKTCVKMLIENNNKIWIFIKRIAALILIIGGIFFVKVLFTAAANYRRMKAAGNFTHCMTNCSKIGEALDAYAKDNDSCFPRKLTALTPKYLKTIPTCPETGKNKGYIDSYRVSWDLSEYTFYCRGENHRGVDVPINFPQYSSLFGIMPKPHR